MDLTEKVEQLTNETAELRNEVTQLKGNIFIESYRCSYFVFFPVESLTKQNQTIIRLIKEQCHLLRKYEENKQDKKLSQSTAKQFLNIFPINSQDDLETAEESINEENKGECVSYKYI